MSLPVFTSPYNAEKRRVNEANDIGAYHGTGKSVGVPPNYMDMDLILFPEGSLRNSNNTVISQDHLRGKSVALYFADGGDPKCTAFLPFLLQFYRTINEGGEFQKIEIIFVSLDKERNSFEKHRSHMPWLHIDLEDPLTDVLKKHFRVLREYEVPLYGYGPRCGVPCVVVIGGDGREAQFLHVCGGRDEGERALLRWDWRNTRFTADRFVVKASQAEREEPRGRH